MGIFRKEEEWRDVRRRIEEGRKKRMAQRGLKFGLRIFFLLSGSPSFTVAAKGLVT